jgi:hypothetical protein
LFVFWSRQSIGSCLILYHSCWFETNSGHLILRMLLIWDKFWLPDLEDVVDLRQILATWSWGCCWFETNSGHLILRMLLIWDKFRPPDLEDVSETSVDNFLESLGVGLPYLPGFWAIK